MRAATEGSLPLVMPQGNLVEVLGREVRQGSPGELMVESFPSRQRQPPCKTNREKSDEAADAAALTYLLTYSPVNVFMIALQRGCDLRGIPLYSTNNGTSGLSLLQLTDAHAQWQCHVQVQMKRLKSLKL